MERGPLFLKYPTSFSEISEDILSKIKIIDKYYQNNLILRNVAMEILADLLITDSVNKKYSEYTESVYLRKLKELYELLDDKYQGLLNALKNGVVSEEEFFEKYRNLKIFANNSIHEILQTDGQLSKVR